MSMARCYHSKIKCTESERIPRLSVSNLKFSSYRRTGSLLSCLSRLLSLSLSLPLPLPGSVYLEYLSSPLLRLSFDLLQKFQIFQNHRIIRRSCTCSPVSHAHNIMQSAGYAFKMHLERRRSRERDRERSLRELFFFSSSRSPRSSSGGAPGGGPSAAG